MSEEEEDRWYAFIFQPDVRLPAISFRVREGTSMYDFFNQCVKTTYNSVLEEKERYSKKL